MKKFLIFFIILFSSINVFASEYNMNSHTSASLNGTKNRYRGVEIDYTGIANTYTFGTKYNGRLSTIETYFDYPFEANTTYTLTYNMNTEDFRNKFGGTYWWDCSDTMNATNQHVGSFTYVSYKKVKFSFRPSENTTCIRVLLGSTNQSSVGITGQSNWRLNSITLYDPAYQSGSSGGQGSSTPTPTPTPTNDYSSIINNQNNNTQDIINNQNDNTSNIIENNNSNTDKIIDNEKELLGNCVTNLYDYNDIVPFNWLTSDNYVNSDLSWSYSNYISIEGGKTYTSLYYGSSGSAASIVFYDSNYNYISGITHDNRNVITWTAPINARFVRDSVPLSNVETFMILDGTFTSHTYVPYGDKQCSSKLDETTDAINRQTDYLMDDSNPNIGDNDFLTMFNSIGVNDPLAYLLTLPTQLINKIVSLSDTCSPINLGTLYGVSLTMPCINIENIIGTSLWNIIDVIFSVSLLVVIFKNLYDTFSNLLTMGAEKEAKEKFSMPTPMDFLSMILGGDR